MVGSWLEEFPALRRRGEELETPLLGEDEGEGTHVCVLEVADVGRGGGVVVFGVVEEDEGGEGG